MLESSESDKHSAESGDDLLSIYEQQSVSMFSLIKTLLATATMPHIILIILLSVIFYVIARIDSMTVFAAMAFTSLSVSYAITALLIRNKTVKNWVTPNEQNSLDDLAMIMRVILRFRICLLPLISAALILILIVLTTGENGIIANANKSIPLALGMLFVAWSIVQGTSFAQWASTTSAKKFHTGKKMSKISTSIVILSIIVGSVSLLLACVFYQLEDFNNLLSESLLESIPFTLSALGVTFVSLSYSWGYKKLSSMKPRLQKFSHRWTVLCHLFITWHLLTIWRQNFMQPSILQVFIEEIALMIFTVFVAIWSMTAKGYKSKFKLITEENALTWGLAFGYAYAGSVAMLTTFFDDIKIVMSIGHAVVVITIFYVHKLVLGKVIQKDNTSVDVKRIVGDTEASKITEEKQIELVQTKLKSSTTTKQESAEVWQEDNDVDWDSEKKQVQIDDIEWDETIDLD